ncbi:ABC transporter permease subunit [Actinospica durhamensis]|uniref:ABC transporter permease subunit n=1 Tax=Actinospica durhamensis TaxID=1508375 RepID=A0A941IQG4_9ACTN|nr:ABC transporter permease subunit [Actinospica durhamensis]MBR7837630.1 ABC transporter permease subunit [Actinospica durhamensis]
MATETASAAAPGAPSEDFVSLEAGLDALESAAPARSPWWRRVLLAKIVPPVVAVVALLLIWDLLVFAKVKPAWVLPGPADVWDELTSQWSSYQVGQAVWDSVSRGIIGFAISVVVGTVLGLTIARIPVLRAAIQPILSGLQSLPSVAWVPIGIMWFGIDDATVYTVVLLGAIPSVAIGLIDGVDQIPTIYTRVGRNLGARGISSARYVLFPAVLPGYVSGLKQGWAFSWRSLMAAELIAVSPKLGPGVGQVMAEASDNNDMAMAFGALIVILIIGIGINAVFFAPIERRLLRSRGLAKS